MFDIFPKKFRDCDGQSDLCYPLIKNTNLITTFSVPWKGCDIVKLHLVERGGVPAVPVGGTGSAPHQVQAVLHYNFI